MTIFLKADGATGNVSTQGYENWIHLINFQFGGISQAVQQRTGNMRDRVKGGADFGLVHLQKIPDGSTAYWFNYAHSTSTIPNVEIDFVTAGNPPFTFQDKLLAYLKAPYGEKTVAKKAYYESHHVVKQKVGEYIERYGESRAGHLRKISFISNREQWLAKVRIGISNFNVVDTEEFKSIAEVMKTSKIIRGGCLAIPIASLDAPEIYHLYKTGGDWKKEMIADAAGTGASIGAGILSTELIESAALFLMFTPTGWIIILVGATASIAGELIAKKYIDSHIDSWRENGIYHLPV